jgi:N utilization substance protein B
MTKPIGKKFMARRFARKVVFSAMYAALVTGNKVDMSSIQKRVDEHNEEVDLPYAQQLLAMYVQENDKIDVLIRKSTELNKRTGNTDVELAILQMATTELMDAQLPSRVVINEAVEIAKEYGAADGYKYINAVLDRIRKHMEGEQD